jgi:hypothetical protein
MHADGLYVVTFSQVRGTDTRTYNSVSLLIFKGEPYLLPPKQYRLPLTAIPPGAQKLRWEQVQSPEPDNPFGSFKVLSPVPAWHVEDN